MPRFLGGSWGWAFSYGPGTPVGPISRCEEAELIMSLRATPIYAFSHTCMRLSMVWYLDGHSR